MSEAGRQSGRAATEAVSPRYDSIETWPDPVLLQALLENQLAAVAALVPALPAIAASVGAAVPRLAAGGRLAYAGAGSSGRIAAQDGAELPPTFGWPRERLLLLIAGGPGALLEAVEGAEDAPGPPVAFHPEDVLVAVAASGATPFTRAALAAARQAGALTIALANSPGAPLLAEAEHPVLLPTGPEPVAGSTRLGAGTAQKAALNLFSTAVMLRLGHVHRGRMVDMAASNAKLRRRAVRMLAELADLDEAAAARALDAAGGSVKLGILVAAGWTAEEGRAALAAAGGELRRVPGRRAAQ